MPRSFSTRPILNPNAVPKIALNLIYLSLFYNFIQILKKMRKYFRFLAQTWTESATFLGDFHAKAENACKFCITFPKLD